MAGESLTSMTSLEEGSAIADLITVKWDEWDGYRKPVLAKWKEVEAYRYATDITEIPDVESAFTHTTHFPVVSTIAQDLEAILMQVVMPHNDYFTFEETGLQPVARAVRMALIKYAKNRTAINGFRKTIKQLISDLISYGNCFSQSVYVSDEKGYTGAKPVRISPYDINFDPTAPSFASSPKIIREQISLGELKRRGDSGEFDEKQVMDLLEKRTGYNGRTSVTEKDQQYVPRGFNSYESYITSGTIEILWFYGDMFDVENNTLHESKIYVVADKQNLLYSDDIKTASGSPHIFKSGWEDMPDNLWSMSPLENIIGINYQINHRENSKSEGLDRTIYPDRIHAGDVEEIFDEETGQMTYITDEGGMVQDIPINTQFLSFDLHIDRLKHEARGASRLPSDLTGFRSQGEKTLGEVTALTEGGMRGFIDKAISFEMSTLEPHLNALIELSYNNFEGVQQIKVRTEDGLIETLKLNKEAFASEGLLVPMGSRRFARKNQLLSSLTQLSATPLAQLASTHISGKKAGKMIEELLEIEEQGLFEDYAQVKEQGEAQRMMNQIEQSNAIDAASPSTEEMMLDQEANGIG